MTSSRLGVHVHAAGITGDYLLALADIDVTVAEVLTALGLDSERQVSIDGEVVPEPASVRAVEVLRTGSSIGSTSRANELAPSTSDATMEVSVVAGLDAGATARIGRGLYRIGGMPSRADSGWYLSVDHQQPLADAPRPWHRHGDSIESLAAPTGVLALSKPIDPESGSDRLVHRPPRRLPPVDVPPIEVPEAPPLVKPRSSLSWATMLAPVPIALAMAFFFRPLFALFAAMGPVMALFRWYESKRRHRKESRQRTAEVAVIVADIDKAIARQAEQIARLRWLTHPHVAELWKRARHHSVRLWERRPGSAGFLEACVGVANDQVDAVISGAEPTDDVHAALVMPIDVRPVPHAVNLAENSGVGVHGNRREAVAVARSILLQLASLHGPADLRIGVICSALHAAEWDWVKWLPHTDSALVCSTASSLALHLEAFAPSDDASITRLIVVDDPGVDVAAIMRASDRSENEVRILSIADHPTKLPAACSSLIHVHGNTAELATPELNSRRAVVRAVGVSSASATSWARSLGALSDPEVHSHAQALAERVSLVGLLGFGEATDLVETWERRGYASPPIASVGLADDGPFAIDLAVDGPHALIAGTTGSGKSELLRTIVVSLAAGCPPDHLNFVLIDFKGGGAFDVVADLPHVAGLVTDLDESLVRRVVGSLRSELERREVLFRELGASTFDDAARLASEPLPRLAVAIDEFAALAADYPDVLSSIVDLAARGRSLGMHLLLATQRPSGVVDQKIRANTNLRVALRVQDSFDSHDVVGTKEAAFFDRSVPGRAIFRVASDPVVRVQTAFTGASDQRLQRCVVRQLALFPPSEGSERASGPPDQSGPTELEALVAAITTASSLRGCGARPLWASPLPSALGWAELRALVPDEANASRVALGLADLPDRQTQSPWYWDLDSGPLAVYASSAECAGTALVSLGAALASAFDPASLHMYIIDGAAGTVGPLEGLAHVGGTMLLGERDRIDRTIRFFENRLSERRRSDIEAVPHLVLMIDNLASLVAIHDDVAGTELVRRLGSLARDGSALRIHIVIAARTARDIGHRLAEHMPNRLVLALADPNGYLTLGMRARDVVDLPAMRALDLSSRHVVQLVVPPDMSGLSAQPQSDASTGLKPVHIAAFPDVVYQQDLSGAQVSTAGVVDIPLGIESVDLSEAVLSLRRRSHALIAAASGMGRSSLMCATLHQLDTASGEIEIGRVCPSGSPLADAEIGGQLATALDIEKFGVGSECPSVLLVDDAEWLDDDMSRACHLLMQSDRDVRIVAATTPSHARSAQPWIHHIRQSQTGVLLGGHYTDGDLFKVRLEPFDGAGVVPGRGHLVVRGRWWATQFAAVAQP